MNPALTRGIAAIVFAVLGAAASAEAETKEETAYGWGELVGAMTSCRLPPGTVDQLGVRSCAPRASTQMLRATPWHGSRPV